MDHVICSVKTGPKQSIVKLNLFNYFEKKESVVKTHDRSETFVLQGNQNIVSYH
jgi:hypothetical protein